MSTNNYSEQIANLSPEKLALLLMKRKKQAVPTEKSTIPAREDRGQAPLSFAQQRLWFLDQIDRGNAVYNVARVVRLSGNLNVAALERSLNEIVRRHEVLRTTFPLVAGQPVQVINPPRPCKLSPFDLRELYAESAEREARALELAKEETTKSFDLASDPLFRASLLQLEDDIYFLLLTMHHIVSDGWSTGVLIRELSALYSAYSKGEESPLAELPVQYADYAVWQRGWLQGEVLERQLEYWRRQLAGAPPVLELPTDKPRPSHPAFNGAKQLFALPIELSEGLKALSQREGVTLFMTLLAAFKVLLYRYTDQPDIVVGSPIAGRTRAEVENLIGCFVNTLVLRTDLSGGPSFKELLGRVRETALGAFAHQDVPFEKLVEELQPERDMSHSPLFQVLFILQNTPHEALRLEGLTLSPVRIETDIAKFDLMLNMGDTGDGIKGALEYDTDLFERETVERLLGHFRMLLEGIVREPQRAVTQLPLLKDTERHQLLVEWNKTEVEAGSESCVHQMFEEQVARTASATALVFDDERLSYADLNARANQLAHHLQSLGVGPEVLVGILMERSVEMVVSLLAVFKAGGAYVPLDPQYPAERLAFMLADANAPVLLTQQRLMSSLPAHNGHTICVDQRVATESTANPVSQVSSENLAYVIYTSGSTGRPKGVAITHRSASLFLRWSARMFSADMAVTLASTSICFDLSVFELFAPLTCGGSVVLVENALRLPEVSAHGITLINTVPSALTELVRNNSVPETVRVVNLGGEAVGRRLVEQVYEKTCAEAVWDLYGPTEDTVYSTAALLERGLERVTIGRPISGTQVYVLDEEFEAVPVGVTGELYLGGKGLARGYLGRPELTAERFIADPFGGEGGRLYRTGDRARFLADGSVEYLGRRDEQVKLRGFRIELGEIEATLQRQQGVKEAVVIVREDVPGEKRLVAYVVGEKKSSELRTALREKLPEYMVPSEFVFLEELPLTPNGKVKRNALPAPDSDRSDLEATRVLPRNEAEEAIAGAWREVLTAKQIGIYDNFFDLGGHSLLLVQIHSRLQEVFKREFSIVEMFRHTTIDSLANFITQKQPQGSASQKVQERASMQKQARDRQKMARRMGR